MASLPNKTFLCNYNARDFVAATNTIPNASGATFQEDLVLNQAPSAVNDTYLTIQKGCYFRKSFSNTDDNPFNRSNSDKLTIIAKTSLTNNSSGNIVSNRGSNWTVNWIFRNDAVGQTYLGGQSGPAPVLTATTTSANTYAYLRFYDGVDNYIVKSYTDNVSASTANYGWGSGASNRFEVFTFSTGNEPWGGDFYWLYISPEALTPAEIQQVINYNEGVGFSVVPSEVELSKAGDSVQVTVESETDWTASTNDSWFTFTPTTGTSATTAVTITAPANYTTALTGTLSFINEGQDTAAVAISQNYIAKPTNLRNIYAGSTSANKMYVGSDLVFKRFAVGGDFSIDTDELDYYGMSGTSTINVSGTYYSWTASTSDSWITLTNPTGSGDGSFSITVANNTEGLRIGTVTVVGRTVSGVVKQHTVNVRQSILQVPLVNSQIWYMTKNNQPVTLNSGFSPSGVSLNNNSYVNQLGVCVISLSGNLTQCNNPFASQATGADNAVIAIAIPNSFTGDKIAANVKDLETVFIGSGCTYLGDGALQGNNSMKEIYCYATTAPTLHNYALYYVTNGGPAQNGVLHIPQGCTASYSPWMQNDKKRLGYYNWTCVDDLPNPNL